MSETFTAEQAVAQLVAAENPPEQVEATAPEIEQTEEQPETVEAEGNEPEAEGEETEEAAADPVAAPDKWDAEDKAWFAEQPPEIQSKILEQETKRELVLNKAREKASEEANERVRGEIDQVRAVAESLQQFLPKAVAAFNQQWGEPDWKATLETYGPEETMRLQIAHREQAEQLQRLTQANDQAEAIARQQFIAAETQKLKEMAPELASDATKQKEVATFLLSNGATQADLENLPAWAAALALDAFKYRNAQAAASAPKPKPPAKPLMKPAAGQALNPTQRTAQQIQNRFAQTGSREDAVALLIAKGL